MTEKSGLLEPPHTLVCEMALEPGRSGRLGKWNATFATNSWQASSLSNHLETQHGVFRSRVVNQDLLEGHESRTYTAHRNVSCTLACQCLAVLEQLTPTGLFRGTSMVVILGTARALTEHIRSRNANVVDCSALIGHSTLHTQHRNTVGRQRKGRCANRLQ